VKFWDASAAVSLLFLEAPSWKTLELFRQDPEVVLWWGTSVECVSALARVEREGQVAEAAVERGWKIFQTLRGNVMNRQLGQCFRAGSLTVFEFQGRK